jgi:cobalamin-dependent methionine synthase I
MKPELRERIIAYNKQMAERKTKADDLDKMLQKLQPVLSVIERLLPDDVKHILEKYGHTV